MTKAIVPVGAFAVWATLLSGAAAMEQQRFEGFRALVIAPQAVWQEWDSAIYGALEERGFAVTYRQSVGDSPSAEGFDLVALNAERGLTAPEQDVLAHFVAEGGVVYVSWDQPYAWGRGAAPGAARFLREVGMVGSARAASVREVVVPESAASRGLPLLRCALKVDVGCFKAPEGGWTAVALEPLPGAVVAATDQDGAVLGTLSEHGTGRTAVMGLPPEQEKYFKDPDLGTRLLDGLLQWLLTKKLERGPAPLGYVTVAVPARAEVTGLYVEGKSVPDAAARQVGSLKTLRLDTSGWPEGEAREIRVAYRPLPPGRNVETVIHMPWGTLRGAADSPAGLAEYLASLGATVCQPLLRSANGRAWYKGLPDDSLDDRLVTNYQGDFLADVIRECHARGIKVIAGIYFDSDTPVRRYPEVKRINRQGQPVQDNYGNYYACFHNPKGQEHNLATIEHLLSHYDVDGLILDDNYWLDYSDMYACYCPYCKDAFRQWCEARGAAYVDPASIYEGGAADLWWEHKREATRALAARVREIARAHGVPAGGWVSTGIGMTHLAGPFDFLGEMDYNSPPRAMRGPLSVMGEHSLICLLWEPNVSGEQLEREVRQAVHAGCQAVGIWTGVVAETYKAPPEKFEAMKRAFGSAEQEWHRFYEDNVLTGDPRFVVLESSAGPEELRLKVMNAGLSTESRAHARQ